MTAFGKVASDLGQLPRLLIDHIIDDDEGVVLLVQFVDLREVVDVIGTLQHLQPGLLLNFMDSVHQVLVNGFLQILCKKQYLSEHPDLSDYLGADIRLAAACLTGDNHAKGQLDLELVFVRIMERLIQVFLGHAIVGIFRLCDINPLLVLHLTFRHKGVKWPVNLIGSLSELSPSSRGLLVNQFARISDGRLLSEVVSPSKFKLLITQGYCDPFTLSTLTPLPHTPTTMTAKSIPNKAAIAASKANFKAGPHATFASPKATPKPIEIDDEEEESEDSEEDDLPMMSVAPAEKKQKEKRSATPERIPILYNRVKTDAPFEMKGILFFKNFGSLNFAVSAADALAANSDIVNNFGMDPDTPLIKYDEAWQCWMLRGKAVGKVAMCVDSIATKKGYTIRFTIGAWANSKELTNGVSASITDLLDKKGNSVVKVDIKFPEGSSYSAGRLVNPEDEEEMDQ